MRKKLVFISNMASPYQVKFCEALQEHLHAEFWFYEHVDNTRPAWWAIPLGDQCRVLSGVHGKRRGKYWRFGTSRELDQFDPDIVMLGGMTIPANYFAYRWAQRHGKKTVLFSEFPRSGGRAKTHWIFTRCIPWLFSGADLLLTPGEASFEYFRDHTTFDNGSIVQSEYPVDIQAYWLHPIRQPKPAYTYIFSHRLAPLFQPLLALDIFSEISQRHPGSRLLMNAAGPLRTACNSKIQELGLQESASFLGDINKWEDLYDVYRQADISLSPCADKCSNGAMSVIEAGTSGCGLIVSEQFPNTSGWIRESQGGFVVSPNKIAFVEAVEKYIQNPDLFRTHVELNRQYFAPRRMDNFARSFTTMLGDRLGFPISEGATPCD